MAACAIFSAAEKRRNEEENRVAEAETKRTGRTVQPVRLDPNCNDEANIPGSELYVEIKTYLQKYVDRLSAVRYFRLNFDSFGSHFSFVERTRFTRRKLFPSLWENVAKIYLDRQVTQRTMFESKHKLDSSSKI